MSPAGHGDAAVLHCLDTDAASAPLRRLLVRDAASSQPGLRHLEIAIGEGVGSGLPSVARVPSGDRRGVARAIAAAARQIEVAAVIAWSNAAGLAIAETRGPGRRLVVLDAFPSGVRERRLRGRGPIEAAAWSAWLESLSPRHRFALEPLRPLPSPGGEAVEAAIAAARRSRPRIRREIGLDADAVAVGLFVPGGAVDPVRSARHDGLNVLALAMLAGMPISVVLDPLDLHAEGLASQLERFGLADRVRTAPLRHDLLGTAAALDLALVAGGADPSGGRPPLDPDAVLLPGLLARSGVCVAAFDQPPWPRTVANAALLLPVSPPLAAAQRIFREWSSPQARAAAAAAGRGDATAASPQRWGLALGGPWSIQVRGGKSRSAAPA